MPGGKKKEEKVPPHQRPDLVSPGTIIKQRWEVVGRIGAGGFGQIHRAIDIPSGKHVAIKLESTTIPKSVLKMEVAVLKEMCDEACVARFYGCGRTPAFNFLVMSLVGQNISELRKGQPGQRFSLPTGLEVGRQMLEGIRAVHDHGVLHRDIKPSNFAIGCGKDDSRRVYILDFGLARLYRTSSGAVRPARTFAGFRGTARYASLNAHRNQELSRRDDLISFFYMMVELLEGKLPWHSLRDKKDVLPSKEQYALSDLVKHLPSGFTRIAASIDGLAYADRPNYELVLQELQDMLRDTSAPTPLIFDWELKGPASTDDNPRSSQADQQEQRVGREEGERKPSSAAAAAAAVGSTAGTAVAKKPPPAPLRPLRAPSGHSGVFAGDRVGGGGGVSGGGGGGSRRDASQASHERTSQSESDRDSRKDRSTTAAREKRQSQRRQQQQQQQQQQQLGPISGRQSALSMRDSEVNSAGGNRIFRGGVILGDSEIAAPSQNVSMTNGGYSKKTGGNKSESGAPSSSSFASQTSQDADESNASRGHTGLGNDDLRARGRSRRASSQGAKSRDTSASLPNQKSALQLPPVSTAKPLGQTSGPIALDADELSDFNVQEENLRELELLALDELDAAIEHGRQRPAARPSASSNNSAMASIIAAQGQGHDAPHVHVGGSPALLSSQVLDLPRDSTKLYSGVLKDVKKRDDKPGTPTSHDSEVSRDVHRPAPPQGPPPSHARRSAEYRKARYSATKHV